MKMQDKRRVNYQFMLVLALGVGILGIAFQFVPGLELLAFMLTVAVLGGLIGGSNGYEERDRQQLARSYKPAYEWLFLIILSAYAFSELSSWLHFDGAVIFLNGHWPGLIIAMMCALMGAAGFQKSRTIEDSA